MLYDSAFVNYTVLINAAILAAKTGYFFFPGLTTTPQDPCLTTLTGCSIWPACHHHTLEPFE